MRLEFLVSFLDLGHGVIVVMLADRLLQGFLLLFCLAVEVVCRVDVVIDIMRIGPGDCRFLRHTVRSPHLLVHLGRMFCDRLYRLIHLLHVVEVLVCDRWGHVLEFMKWSVLKLVREVVLSGRRIRVLPLVEFRKAFFNPCLWPRRNGFMLADLAHKMGKKDLL